LISKAINTHKDIKNDDMILKMKRLCILRVNIETTLLDHAQN
jgi:hypothetical protein